MQLNVQIQICPGNEHPVPLRATPQSAAYDLPVVLSRPCLTLDGARFGTWKRKRFTYLNEQGHVLDYLRASVPEEIPKIKELGVFPVIHLSLLINPGETIFVPLGIKTAFSEEYVCLLAPRASSAKKEYRLGNCLGIIDADYRDEWFAAITNRGTKIMLVKDGDRLVQGLWVERGDVTFETVDSLPVSDRAGGFGSTDTSVQENAMPEELEEKLVDKAIDREQDELIPADTPDTSTIIPDGPPPVSAKPVRPRQDTFVAPAPQAATVPGERLPVTADFWPVQLVCNGVEIGPIAKFRPGQYTQMLKTPKGQAQLQSILTRESNTLMPRVMPALLKELQKLV